MNIKFQANHTSAAAIARGLRPAGAPTRPTIEMSHLAVAFAGMLSLGMPGLTWAACTSGNGINYTCSGATSTAQALTGSNLVVNADSTFNADIASGTSPALSVENASGAVTVTTAAQLKNQNAPLHNSTGAGSLTVWQQGVGAIVVNQSIGSAIDSQGAALSVFGRGPTGTTADINLAGPMTAKGAGLYFEGPHVPNIKQEASSIISCTGGNSCISVSTTAPAGDTTVETHGGMLGVNTDRGSAGGVYVVARSGTNIVFNQVAGTIASDVSSGVELSQFGPATGEVHATSNALIDGGTGHGIRVNMDPSNSKPVTIEQKAGRVVGSQGIIVSRGSSIASQSLIEVANEVESIGTTPSQDTINISTTKAGTTPPTIIRTFTDYVIDTALPGALGVRAFGGDAVINLKAGSHVKAPTQGLAIQSYGSSDVVTMEAGSKVTGAISLGSGNDALIVKGNADLTAATVLDGGNSFYQEQIFVTQRRFLGNTLVSGPTLTETKTDLLGTPTAATNKLSFDAATQSLAGSIMKNWQTVALSGSTVTFAGDAALITGTGTNPDASLQGVVLQNSTLTSPVALAVRGDVNIDSTSTLRHAIGGSITGKVSNAGTVYWGNLSQTLQVVGDYAAGAGAKMSLETVLAGDSSATDRLHITGNTSGTTEITVRPAAGSSGALTSTGILVVQVDGSSDGIFVLPGGSVTAGSFTYTLNKVGNNWYLQSKVAPAGPTGTAPTFTTPLTRPEITGTVDDPAATVQVLINGQTYPAVNNGNGTWTLPANTVAALTQGSTYPMTVTFTNAASLSSTTQGAVTVEATVNPGATVTPVPMLSQSILLLLSALLGGLAFTKGRRDKL